MSGRSQYAAWGVAGVGVRNGLACVRTHTYMYNYMYIYRISPSPLPVDILQNQWSPIYDVSAILTSIQSLLCDPNPASPANSEASRLYQVPPPFHPLSLPPSILSLFLPPLAA